MTPLHSGKSGLSCATSIGPAQYMREEMLTPSPPPNWGQHFSAAPDRTGEMEFKDEVRRRQAMHEHFSGSLLLLLPLLCSLSKSSKDDSRTLGCRAWGECRSYSVRAEERRCRIAHCALGVAGSSFSCRRSRIAALVVLGYM